MVGWPDISRRIWSYILSRLRLFADVDPSKLELSGKSLSLTNVELDKERVAFPGMRTTAFTIERLKLELNTWSVAVVASGVQIEAEFEHLEAPDLAISRILESTKADLEEGYGAGDTSGMVSKLADMALSHITAHISSLKLKVRLPSGQVSVDFYIDEIIMRTKHKIEIESVAITRVTPDREFTSSSDGDDDSDADDLIPEEPMARSMYFDANSSLHLGTQTCETVGFINQINLEYTMEPMMFSLAIDQVKLDFPVVLETLVDLGNELISSTHQPMQSRKNIDATITIEAIELYESLDSELSPLKFQGIYYDLSSISVGSLDLEDVVHVSPLLSAHLGGERVSIEMDMPLSLSLAVESLPFLRSLWNRLTTIVAKMEYPENTQQTQLEVRLPDVRVAIGTELTVLVFPRTMNGAHVELSEVIFTAKDGQLLVRDIKADFLDQAQIIIGELQLRLTEGFLDEMSTISRGFESECKDVTSDTAEPASPWRAFEFSAFHLSVPQIVLESDYAASSKASLDISSSPLDFKLESRGFASWGKSKGSFQVIATSMDNLASFSLKFRLKDAHIDVPVLRERTASASSEVASPLTFPAIQAEIDFANGIWLHFPDPELTTFLVTPRLVRIDALSDGGIRLLCSELAVFLEDPSTSDKVRILKSREIKVTKLRNDTEVTTRRLTISTCADSYNLILGLASSIFPPQSQPIFFVDPEKSINVFDEVSDEQFVASVLPSREDSGDVSTSATYLDIKDDYMASQTANPLEVSSYLGNVAGIQSVKFFVRIFQWKLYDGFDLQRTRDSIEEAVSRVEDAAAEVTNSDGDESSDDESSAVVGDFMYNSLFITSRTSQATGLRDKIVGELEGTGSSGLARSAEPKISLVLRKCDFLHRIFSHSESRMSLVIQDGKVVDSISTSAVTNLLVPIGSSHQDLLIYTQDTMGLQAAPELKVTLAIRPIHLRFDQDTVEFAGRFFQFDNHVETKAGTSGGPMFIQRFEFAHLPLIIDYTPKKVDYRSLRSGMAAELLNLFVVRGAKLSLQPSTLYGVNGWDRLLQELLALWMPDIKAHQLTSLIAGVGPVRRALKVGKGVKKVAVVPMNKGKSGEITRGAGIVVRRTVDELLRIGAMWLDSADKALSGEASR